MEPAVTVNVAQDGWITLAENAIKSKQCVRVVVSGNTLLDAVKRTYAACQQLHVLDLLKKIPGVLSALPAGTGPAITAVEALLIPVISAVGAVGGAGGGVVGSVIWVTGYAFAHGDAAGPAMKPFRLSDLLKPTSWELWLTFEP